MNGFASSQRQQPLYPSTIDPELNSGGRRYEDVANWSSPPAGVLERHYSEEGVGNNGFGGGDGMPRRYNPLNKARPQSSALLDINDSMAMHLLVTTAIVDSRDYEVLSFQEVEDLKKESDFLANRIDASKRKLALESKVRDAALSLSRLYSKKSSSSGKRRSLLGSGGSGGGGAGGSAAEDLTKHTDEELVSSNRKCEELSMELWRLSNRHVEIQRRLLQHAAGVLGMTHQKASSQSSTMVTPGSPSSNYTYAKSQGGGVMSPLTEEFDDRSFYRTADKLGDFEQRGGRGGGERGGDAETLKNEEEEEAVVAMRLEDTNHELREFIVAYTQDQDLPVPKHLPVNGDMQGAGTEEQLTLLEENIRYIRENPPAPPAPVVDPGLVQAKEELEKTEAGLADLWDMIIAGEEDARRQKVAKRQAQVNNDGAADESDDEDLQSPQESYADFTVPAFLEKVSNVHARAMKLQDEKTILKRQIQQQRRRFEDEFGALGEDQQAKVDDLSTELENMESQVGQLSTLLEQREEDLVQSNNKLQRSVEELRLAQEQLQDVQLEMEGKKEEVAVLVTQLDAEKRANQQRELENQQRELERSAGTEKEAEALEAIEAEHQARLEAEEAFVAQIREKEDKLAELQREFDEVREDRDIAKAELDAVSEETDARFQLLEDEIAMLKEGSTKLEEETKKLEEGNRKLLEEQRQLEEGHKKLEESNRQLEDGNRQLLDSNRQLEDLNRQLENSKKQLETGAQQASSQQEETLRNELSQKEAQIKKMDQEIAELSNKVAELSMEVVMAKAELDSVSGSRQQRAAETAEAKAAAAALAAASKQPQSIDPGLLQEIEDLAMKNQELIEEIVALKTELAGKANNEHLEKRCRDLQKELNGMLADFENLTKQGIEAETERGRLEAVIDGLRERCEEQETSLAEERIRLLAAPPPTTGVHGGRPSIGDGRSPRGESTSTNVLKMEFKKMMRDMRAEQQKALRAEQDERRKLEAMVRAMKKEQLQQSSQSRRGTPRTSVS